MGRSEVVGTSSGGGGRWGWGFRFGRRVKEHKLDKLIDIKRDKRRTGASTSSELRSELLRYIRPEKQMCPSRKGRIEG
ncbi:hypothetical protein HZH68_012386 [Vespula germanica]|uniref:Uncharacterized protein n=1 Tax=Vespula germanica TaxID=30212 RepID=A0A834MYI1_VESGE|nr:hypothetical protein HZH68_012386 [Vespula germanica]